ncbi:MAG: PBP1A family penicillin-binding protein [Candidatus Moraniibacteriota bacterium]|nr:MAG: PBP1A family penicillin-binding protein [Candidatus Moranbacteria bacterium]
MEHLQKVIREARDAWQRLRRDPDSLPSRLADSAVGRWCARFSRRRYIPTFSRGPLGTVNLPQDAMKKSLSPSSPKKKSGFWKWVLRIFLGCFLAGVISVIGVFAYFAKDLPSPGKVNARFIAESTKILDRTGEHLLYEVHGEEKRTIIPFSEMPETVRAATITLEDQDFYSHHGIKFSSIMRAVFKDFVGGGAQQGGSTITQQFVKNSLLTPEKTFTRKIKEAILSVEMEQKFSKDEILAMYLNEIPYGSNAYGLEAAAQTFFGKNAKDLTLDESALLASLPNAPTYYSPYGSHLEELKARQAKALTAMASLGYITADQADEAKAIDTLEKLTPQHEQISAPHFVMYVKEYLAKHYGDDQIEQGGLKVITTLDWDKQQAAEQAVSEGAEKNLRYNAENASLVAIDPKTGQILAMVGSKNYFDTKIDGQVNVAIRDRQPGSSFKPYVYLDAFTKGYVPETVLYDVPTNFSTDDGKSYEPQNYDGTFHGPIALMKALGGSLNIPAVKVLYLVGVKDAITLAKNLGITTLNQPDRYGLSLVLGGGEVKLLDHVNAYATLATGGIKHEKTAILRIENSKGEVQEEYQDSPGERIVAEKFVAMLDSVLSNNDNRAWVFGANSPLRFDNRPVVAKTGTTNEWRDAWTIGYTPSLAVGVWAGNNDNTPMKPGSDGSYVAAPIWRAFLDKALENTAVEEFPKYNPDDEIVPRDNDGDLKETESDNSTDTATENAPSETTETTDQTDDPLDPHFPKITKPLLGGWIEKKEGVKVCEIPKSDNLCLASDACPEKEQFKRDFISPHDILFYVDRNDPRGPIPDKPDRDPQYKLWDKAAEEWYGKDKKVIFESPPTEKCSEKDFSSKFGPSISLSVPSETSDASFSISAEGDAPYGVDSLEIFVDGDKVDSSGSDSLSTTYAIPNGKRGDTLSVEARLKDNNGNEVKTSKDVKTTAPSETS